MAQSTPDAGRARGQEVHSPNNTRAARAPRHDRQAATSHRLADPFAGGQPQDALTGSLGTTYLDGQAGFASADRDFGPAMEFQSGPAVALSPSGQFDGLAVTRRTDVWFESGHHTDRLRLTTRGALRRVDGAPLPVTPMQEAELASDSYDVSYTRGWPVARGYTASGLEVTLTPHAGFGVGDEGGSAEAGATLRIGDSLDRLAPDGGRRFGDRARWYLYAAGSGRAFGYNFARTRDGDYARSGVSQDKGSFLGDASLGVAYRRGPVQGSMGVVYREIKAEGLRGGEGLDREVTEGLVAFQLSIRPQW